jgi:hypothetical protein
MKRYSFTLVEVMISLLLVSLLLSTLFVWYHFLSSQKETCKELKAPLMEERYAYQRLQHILPRATTPFFQSQDGQSLLFVFDRGPFWDPKLAGQVIARLYHDKKEKLLCLGIWPLPTPEEVLQTPTQTWILLDKINSCTFRFYNPPDPYKQPVDPKKVDKAIPLEGWQEQWRGDFRRLPAMMQIILTRGSDNKLSDKEFAFSFDFPGPITFVEEHA